MLHMKVLYILGCNEGPSKRYRVFNHIDYLKIHHIEAEWVWDIHPEIQDVSFVKQFSIVVNFRGGYSDRIEKLFEMCRSIGVPTVYDVDDLVYDSSLVNHIDAYNLMDEQAKFNYLNGIESISKMVMSSDFLTTSTPFLNQHIQNFSSKKSFLIPFGFNEMQYKLSLTRCEQKSTRFIGYLSGTKTHERDFGEAATALKKILMEYDDVYLKVIGYLDVEKHLPGLSHKVIQIPFMHWESLVFETTSLYMAIAPFDASSDFCQSKSDLKFVEPALCRVPIVASEISSFCSSIVHGVSGYIARNADEWYSCMKVMLDSGEIRNNLGNSAYDFIMKWRSPEVLGGVIRDAYLTIIQKYRLETTLIDSKKKSNEVHNVDKLRMSWIIPQPFEASGGHRNIFRAIKYMSEFGHECSLHVLPDNHRFETGREIREFITKEFFDIDAEHVCHGVENIDDCDVLICTYWTTAYVARINSNKAKLIVYFLQDYEPMFFPMGVDFVRAANTYKFGFYPITSGPWPLKMLESRHGATKGTFFRFPIDRKIYYPSSNNKISQKIIVLFFARPEMPRRCYPLGVEALSILKSLRPDVEVVFYGDENSKYINVNYEITKLGKLPDIAGLGELYRSAHLGICFSTTNPSLVPYEMMACGCPVVDLDINGNDVNYGGRENSVLVDPDPRTIALAIVNILENKQAHQNLVDNGLKYANNFPEEVDMARTIEKAIFDQIH